MFTGKHARGKASRLPKIQHRSLSWDELKRELGKVEKPARYTGGEVNSVRKDPAHVEVRFALAFPDVYEVGASHLGSHILYSILNGRDDTACERAYAPWPDMEALLRRKGWPLYTLESFTPLSEFDIVGFSLQYELTYTNVLAMLDLGGIPLRTSERAEGESLVIAGGPCAMAPEPLAEFIDAFALGDGEEITGEIVDAYKEWKKSGQPRSALLLRLASVEGVYVPSLYKVDYTPDGKIASIAPVDTSVPRVVKRRILPSMETAPLPCDPLVPLIPPIHDRAMVEIFRGCTQGCRFCQAGMLYRPVREREPETVDSAARSILGRSGYDEVSLVSLSSADYSRIADVVTNLVSTHPCGARVSLPSLRVDSFSVRLAEMIGSSAKSGLTLAPEAGSQRMRDAINKKVTEDEVMDAARAAFTAGYSHIKVYFMVGLPSETDEDVLAIADLVHKIRQAGRDLGRKPTVVVSVSGFVPKPHTPFQWEAATLPEELMRRQRLLRGALRGPGLEYRYHEADMTQLEAVFARGDRRLGKVLEMAFRKGRRFDAWPDRFVRGDWLDAISEAGLNVGFYAHREREKDEAMPWEHLSAGVRKSFLWREKERSEERVVTADCRSGVCAGCGVCPDFGVGVALAKGKVAG